MPFDAKKANRAVTFIESLPQVKGRWAGSRFRLMKWQRAFVRKLFGTVREDGFRQYRTAYLEIPRKNGKTTLAAAIALYLLFADGEAGAEIYGAAFDRDQASLVFDIAAEMVRRTPELARRAQIVEYKKRIVHPRSASFYRAIPRDAAGSHGFNASGIVFDELHTQPTADLHDVLTTSTGVREQPLLVEITTAGFNRTTICWREHDHARKVLEGIVEDPTFLPAIYSATEYGENEEDVDWQDEELWKKANPALGEFLSLDYMREKARKAETDPAFLNVFKRLHLNIWTQAETRYIPGDKWDACRGEISDEDLVGRPCWAGLDAASKTDLAAFLLVFDLGARVAIRPHFWIPRDTIIQRSRDDGVPYATWHDRGLVTATAGNWIDYDTIERDILAAHDKYQIRELGYDPWDVTQMVQHLEGEGITIVPVRQGFQSLNPPTKELLRLILSREFLHDGNPIMRWNMDNLMVETDAAGNTKPSKKASTEKIDGMVALIIAISRMMGQEPEEESAYNDPDHDLFVIE